MRVLSKEVVRAELYTLLETTDGCVKVYPDGKVEYYDEKLKLWILLPKDCSMVTALSDQGFCRRHDAFSREE